MPKLPSSKEIIAVLLANGFEKVSQKGSHHKYCKGNRIVIVPSTTHRKLHRLLT